MADVQVGLGAVVGDEHLTVLERVHRARVDVQVRVELLHRDPQAARLEQRAQAGGGQALAEGGGDTPGDEDVLGRRGCAVSKSSGRHGQEGAPVVASLEVRYGCPARRVPEVPSLRFGGPCSCTGRPPVHGLPGYQRPGEAASGHALHTGRTVDTDHTSCSLVRLRRVVGSGARIISVRRILLGRLAAEPGRQTAPPRPSPGTSRARQFVSRRHHHDNVTSRDDDLQRPLTARATAPRGATWPFDWSCTWPGASRTTHSSETCRPPRWSAGTARWTGCACPASTPMPSSPGCSAPRNTGSGGSARRTPADAEPPTAARRRYRGDSLILESEWDTPRGTVRVTDFMPPRDGAPAADPHRRGRHRPRPDALRAADALLVRPGGALGAQARGPDGRRRRARTRCGSTPSARPTART